MRISKRGTVKIFFLLIILNIIMRTTAESREIGSDSFIMHVMVNSLNEFGQARWFQGNLLSIFGVYPGSYSSSMQFFVSGISQTTGMEMGPVILLYCIFLCILSIFTAYLMAGEIIRDNLFKFLTAFAFSTSPAVVSFSTWTIHTRTLLVITAPLLFYLLLKSYRSFKFFPLAVLFAVFLFATHNLFYFLIPAFFVFFIILAFFSLRKHLVFEIPKKMKTAVPIIGFVTMYSVNFLTNKFIEYSRYAPIWVGYVRQIGPMIILAVSGLVYLIFKQKKGRGEWFLLSTIILTTTFIYLQTYLKHFIVILVAPLAAIALTNIYELSDKKKYALHICTLFLVLTIVFVGYFQFIHFLPKSDRYIDDSTFNAGVWAKSNMEGSGIVNNALLGLRFFAISEDFSVLLPNIMSNQIYGFKEINQSEVEYYPLSSKDFWFTGFKMPALGERTFKSVHDMRYSSHEDYGLDHFIEFTVGTKSYVYWNHGPFKSNLLTIAYEEKNNIYDNGRVVIWDLSGGE